MNQHTILKKYVIGLSRSYANSLIVVSTAGMGKTETTLTTLQELNLKEGQEFLYLTNYITPVELYLTLEMVNKLNEPKLLILDDCETILEDKKIIGILKSALWQTPNGKRKVNWCSGTYKIKNKELEFEGRIIFLLNQFNRKNNLLKAIADRGFFYTLNLTLPEMFKLMEERAKLPYFDIPYHKRLEIIEFLKKVGRNNKNISLRLLPKSFNLYLLSPNHYKELILEIL